MTIERTVRFLGDDDPDAATGYLPPAVSTPREPGDVRIDDHGPAAGLSEIHGGDLVTLALDQAGVTADEHDRHHDQQVTAAHAHSTLPTRDTTIPPGMPHRRAA